MDVASRNWGKVKHTFRIIGKSFLFFHTNQTALFTHIHTQTRKKKSHHQQHIININTILKKGEHTHFYICRVFFLHGDSCPLCNFCRVLSKYLRSISLVCTWQSTEVLDVSFVVLISFLLLFSCCLLFFKCRDTKSKGAQLSSLHHDSPRFLFLLFGPSRPRTHTNPRRHFLSASITSEVLFVELG